MTFDENRQRIVLFGGITAPDSSRLRYSLGDTWEWTGRRWIQQDPAHSPTPRSGHLMVFDTHNQRTLLFGGSDGIVTYNDLWQFKNGDWSQVAVTGASPEGRRQAAGAYDPILKRLLIYGGGDSDSVFRDTWALDVTTNSWTRLGDNGPELKVGAALGYDVSRDQFILLGANNSGTSETYRLSGSTWTKLTTERVPPCATQSGLVYQEHRKRLLQSGGLCMTNSVVTGKNAETFEWDGTNWIRDQSGTSPGSVAGYAMAYDPRQKQVVMFGGSDFEERSSTFRYNERWIGSKVWPLDPGPRSLSIPTRDPLSNDAMFFGGRDGASEMPNLWRLDREAWRLAPGAPSNCGYIVGTYDSDRKKLVIVCESSSVWEWDGATWKEFKDFGKDDKPPIRRFSSMVYDPITKKSYLFGGYDPDVYIRETWAWDGVRWTEVKTESKSSPTSRMLSAMFFDPHSQRMLLFGGIGRKNQDSSVTRYDDMWSFNGSTYTLLTPSTRPSARYGAAVAVAPARTIDGTTRPARVLMFGGKDAAEKYLNELWEWTGSTWVKVESVNTPSPRMNGAFFYDEAGDRFIYFGGWSGYTIGETWQLKGNTWSRIVTENNHSRPVSREPIVEPASASSARVSARSVLP